MLVIKNNHTIILLLRNNIEYLVAMFRSSKHSVGDVMKLKKLLTVKLQTQKIMIRNSRNLQVEKKSKFERRNMGN